MHLGAGFTLLMTVLSVSGCANPFPGAAATSAEGLHGTRWSLVSWSGQADSAIVKSVTLQFEGDGISGEGPCNIYNASFTLQSGALQVGPVAATKRGCDPQRMQLERDWFDTLGKLDRLALEGSRMLLSSDDGIRLEFVRADKTPSEP